MTYKENPLSQTGNGQRAGLQGAFLFLTAALYSFVEKVQEKNFSLPFEQILFYYKG